MTALVTGSTDGGGRLVARKLGEAGARVLVHGRDAERGARVVADTEASGGAANFLAADLSALAEVRRLADAAGTRVAAATPERRFGRCRRAGRRLRWRATTPRGQRGGRGCSASTATAAIAAGRGPRRRPRRRSGRGISRGC